MPRQSTAKCGTKSAYERHRRNKEETCQKCRDARAAYQKQYRHDRGLSKHHLIPDAIVKQHGIQVGK